MNQVRTMLGSSLKRLSDLCVNERINVWSEWKPINCNATTLTEDLIKQANYGLSIIEANSVTMLYNRVVANDNKGYVYNRPIGTENSPYRLGDFRNYDHSAKIPLQTTYNNGDSVYTGGITSDNKDFYRKLLIGLEMAGNGITKDELYNEGLKRGALVTDGVTTKWSTEYIPWGNWTEFNGEVTVFEFLTNVDNNLENSYTATSDDRFYSLPEPIRTVVIDNTVTPPNSRTVFVEFNPVAFTDTTNAVVSYRFRLSSIGDTYAGDTIKNLGCALIDVSGTIIALASFEESIIIGEEETTVWYSGTLNNRAVNNVYPATCTFAVFYNNQLLHTVKPLLSNISPVNE